MQAEIDAGQPAEELQRINNLAWEFMKHDGLSFEQAINLAAEIVAHGQIAACEAAYADVQSLWQRLTERQIFSPPLKEKNA